MTKPRLERILRDRLKLRSPRFRMRKDGEMVSGSVISETFRGKGDHERQRMRRDVVEAELGEDANRLVGTLLAYTPDEWDIDLVAFSNGHRASNGRRAKAG